MDRLDIYIPTDRRHALARGETLPDRATGTAVFADISGFTPLAEALAREIGEQRGAEELTRYLNQVYDVLIAEVDKYGGSVIGFSGDAITCWFDGDPGLRATTCSFRMQQAMEKFRGIHLASGNTLTLAVKCAVASGPVRRFIVGDPSIQLIDALAGATLDQLAATERHAHKDEVVLSPETVALVKDVTIAEWRTDEGARKRFGVASKLRNYADTMPWPDLPPNALKEEQIRLWLLPLIYERMLSGQDSFLAELRMVVALFLRFEKIDYDHDPVAGQKLAAYIRWVQEVVTRYGGFLLELTIGDKGSYCYATFGAPISYDDNAARAVAAANLLRTPPMSLDYITVVQIGLSEGQVRVGPYGGSTRRGYGVIGDEVNLAARLMQLAGPGQVVVSKRVANRASANYRFHPLGSVNIKGRQEPIPVFELLDKQKGQPGNENTSERHLTSQANIIGRTKERSLLTVPLWNLFSSHVSDAIIITGEAGIGKSLLAKEMLRDAKALDLTCLTGAGDAIERFTPYHAWREVFSQLFQLQSLSENPAIRLRHVLSQLEAEPDLLRVAPLLNAVLPFDIPDNDLTVQMAGQVRADNTHAFLTRLLQRAGSENPLVMIMEDAHWLDSASWALMLEVRQNVHPAVLIISTRPLREPVPSGYGHLINQLGTRQLHLEPLPPEDIVSLVCSRLGVGTLPAQVSRLIREKAEGHPFFSEELAYALRDRGLITLQGEECHIAPNVDFKTVSIPDTIQGVITSRIDRLSPAQQVTIKAASAVGRVFEFRLLRDIHPLEHDKARLSSYLEELQKRELTLLDTPEPDLAYLFKHVITQEIAYNLMLFAQRRDLHRAIAEWYERTYAEDLSSYYSLLAYHWDKAESNVKSVEYLEKAGEQAHRNGAYREAISFFSRAIELEPRLAGQSDNVRRAHWQRLMGEASLGIGNVAEARLYYLKGLSDLKAPIPANLPGLGIGILLGIVRQFMHRMVPTLFLGKARDPRVNRELSRLYVKLAQIDYFRNETMLLMYESLSNLNVAENLGPSLELAGGYASMGLICGFIPIRRLAENYMHLSRATIEAGNQPAEISEIYEYFGIYQSGAGRLAEANKAFQYAVDTFKLIGDKRLWEENATLLSMVMMPQAKIDQSAQLREELYTIGSQRGNTSTQCWSLLGLAEIAILRNRIDSALDSLAKSEALAEEMGVGERIWHQGLLARAYWRIGKPELAEQAAHKTLAMMAKATPVNFYALEGYAGPVEVLLRMFESKPDSSELQRSTAEAARALHKFAKVFPLGQPRALVWQGVYAWLTGNVKKAHEFWQASMAAAEQLGIPHDRALAQYEIGRHLKINDPARQEYLQSALELFDQLGAAYDRDAVQSALDQM